MSTLFVANLNCESQMAQLILPHYSQRTLPAKLMRRLTLSASLLRAFAQERDIIATETPLETDRIAPIAKMPFPQWIETKDISLSSVKNIVSWGETSFVEKLRSSLLESDQASLSSAQVAAQVNHRAFAFQVIQESPFLLSGARLLSSFRELENHLATGGANASPTQCWVLKKPFSAAGRGHIIGGQDISVPLKKQIERSFFQYQRLLFEPWMSREADFACSALLSSPTPQVLSWHRLENSSQGQFLGATLAFESETAPGLYPEERDLLDRAIHEAGKALYKMGYRGAFTVDAWRYRDSSGAIRFHPLGEINARLSFGLVLKKWASRLYELGRIDSSDFLRLVISSSSENFSKSSIPLVFPTSDDPFSIHLEVLTKKDLHFF